MCGVAGYINFGKKPNKDTENLIKTMLDSIKYRGPDFTKYIHSEFYSFGTNRLAIQEINNGDQPIEDEKFIVGFNGEIFNYFDLRKEIYFKKINSEVKLILELYKKYGTKYLNPSM